MSSSRVVAPGVYYQELDLSGYAKQLSDTIIGVVTTASKGPFDTRTIVTTATELERKFGPASELHPGLLVARNFLEHGGSRAVIVRVGNSTTAATAKVDIDCIDGVAKIRLEASETGTFFNDLDVKISHAGQVTGASETDVWSFTVAGPDALATTLTKLPLVPGTLSIKDGSTLIATDDGAGVLVFEAGATEYSAGTVDYETGEIACTSTGHGSIENQTMTFKYTYFSTFTLQVIHNLKDSNNAIIRTKDLISLYNLTLNTLQDELLNVAYFAPLTVAPTKFPKAGTYSMAGGNDGLTGIADAHFIGDNIGGIPSGLQLFVTGVDVNEVFIPGRSSASIRQALIQLAEERSDCMVCIDPPSNADKQGVVDWIEGTGAYAAYGVLESNRACVYFPTYLGNDSNTAEEILLPPSAALAETLGRTDWWQAPAGPLQGRLRNCNSVTQELSVGDRAYLGEHRINPIGDLNGMGIQILGQYTATKLSTSLDRIGARRALLRIEKVCATLVYPQLFKPNEVDTWLETEGLIQPYLNTLAAKGRIYEGKVYCNSITNDQETVNNNTMSVVIILSLLKYAEKIVLTFEQVVYGVKITEALISKNIVGL